MTGYEPGSDGGSGAAAAAFAPFSATSATLPIEDIYVAPQHQPANPEDEDDVVPDQHAAYGIARAMDEWRGVVWRDLGLEELMRGVRVSDGGASGAVGRGASGGGHTVRAERRAQGRRTVCLR